MLYDVNVLGGKGGDPVDALRAGPKRGELLIKNAFTGGTDPSLYAELLDQATGQAMFTPITHVRVVAMDRKGMTLEGTQSVQLRDTKKCRVEHFAQRWLCKVPGAKAELDTVQLLKRSAARLKSKMVSGFDPEDNDRVE